MKRILLLFFCILSVAIGFAQNDAVYVYRNDGMINAFLKSDIERMCYSKIDVDSVKRNDYVVQEIWTADSIYRIPLAVVDSVSYNTPKTKYKPDAINIAETFEQYVISADYCRIFLQLDTPKELIPSVGTKLAYPKINELFPYGFSGKVESISEGAESIELLCEEIPADQVFDTFYCVLVSEESNVDDSKDNPQAPQKAPSLPHFGVQDGHTFELPPIVFPERKVNLMAELSPYFWSESGHRVSIGDFEWSLTTKSTYNIKAFYIINSDYGIYVQPTIIGHHEVTDNWQLEGGLHYSLNRTLEEETIRLPYGFNFYIAPGWFFDAAAEVVTKTKTIDKFESRTSFDFSTKGMTSLKRSNVTRPVGHEYEGITSIDGRIAAGLYVEIGFNYVHNAIARLACRVEGGLEVSGSYVLNSTDVEDTKLDTNLYQRLQKSKIRFTPYVATSIVGNVLGLDGKHELRRDNFNYWERDLVPEFRNTQLTRTPNSSSSIDAYSELYGDCLFSVPVGYKLYDENDKEVADINSSNEYMNKPSRFRYTFDNVSSGKYTVYPKVRLFDHDILASPCADTELKITPPEIVEVKQVGSQHKEDGFFYEGHFYDYKYEVSVTTSIDNTQGVKDWGYYYVDPKGNELYFTFGDHQSPCTNTYTIYSDQKSLSTTVYSYILYEGDTQKFYGEKISCSLSHIEEVDDDQAFREYLVRLYETAGGENWKCKDNWCSDLPVTDWVGVTKSEAGYFIDLHSNGLEGYIDMRGCTALQTLWCSSNLLTHINVAGCTSLQSLSCGNNQLTSLDVTGCNSLQSLTCGDNQLTSLHITGCNSLQDLFCYSNQLTSLDLTESPSLQTLNCYRNQLTRLDVTACTSLRSLSCSNNQLTSLYIVGCTSLQTLNCNHNQLTNLDLSICPSLEKVEASRNPILKLNASGLEKLSELLISSCNSLEDLNVSGCMSLESLSIQYSCLKSLNASGCISLKRLFCAANQLTSLDVTGCNSLQYLSCESNQLTSLDLTGHPSLQTLYCYDNQLINIKLARCSSLQDLNLSLNPLTNLDVTGCTSLQRLYCSFHQLTRLTVTECTSLETLNCYDNQLTSLDVTGCTSLRQLDCYNNRLNSLNVTGCASLQSIVCYNNQLTSLDVTGCTSLLVLHCYNNIINQVIDEHFSVIPNFRPDWKYEYDSDNNGNLIYYTNPYGWWYPNEPYNR